jgi:hypothetical protein
VNIPDEDPEACGACSMKKREKQKYGVDLKTCEDGTIEVYY